MINPRYVGTDKNNQPFAGTSDVARQSADDRMKIDLDVPKGDIALNDGTWLMLTAETGVYARTDKTLDLVGGVTLFHDSGYELRTDSAFIDLEKGTAEGGRPVRGQGPFGDLRSEGFILLDKGKVIYFTGKSKLVIHPGFRLNPS
jgi:lipopolysaccharide export system protein LptC